MNAVKDRPPRLTRQHIRDRDWVSEHIQELVEKYPNQWIAVHKGEVRAHSATLGPVYDKAKEQSLFADRADFQSAKELAGSPVCLQSGRLRYGIIRTSC